METNFENMCRWERQKAIYLLSVAEQLGMDTSGYGEVNVNKTSGYTYLWLEDYPFTLYMPISCELKKEDVYIQWTDFDRGEEYETNLNNMSLDDIYKWVQDVQQTIKINIREL